MHRTTITLDVLSEDPIHERMELGDILRECDDGAFILHSLGMKSKTLTDEQMAHALLEAGSDPGFFQLDHIDVDRSKPSYPSAFVLADREDLVALLDYSQDNEEDDFIDNQLDQPGNEDEARHHVVHVIRRLRAQVS